LFCHDQGMRDRIVRWLYRRTGAHYWLVVVAAQGGASVGVALVTVILASTYFDPPVRDVLAVAAAGGALTFLALFLAGVRSRPNLARFRAWQTDPAPTDKETVEVWQIAATSTLTQFRRESGRVNLVAVLPANFLAMWLWDIGWAGFWAMLLACVVPAFYGTVVGYSIGEILTRPMVEEIAARLPDDFAFEARGLPLVKRLHIALPAYTMAAGVLAVILVGHRNGAAALAATVVVAGVVGLALSLELTVLLAGSIARPVSDVRRQLARVREGDYSARTPVLTSDELGELAHDFNLMVNGLQEREEIREAFGTYMDKEVVALILSGQFPPEGVEVVASMLFCDVRGFTSYAERASAPEVIAALNDLFSAIVPIVEKYGGHVDKFMGDGLLAVFGTPEAHVDHADRAVAAAREIVTAVHLGETGLRIGAGVNTGPVVAGPIGGSGRLNFSVIGDAVNVAARVESATRETGDDVLITDATRRALTHSLDLDSRGSLPLKGKAEPIELFAVGQLVAAR
jgi:class 3 adenylate cyclase